MNHPASMGLKVTVISYGLIMRTGFLLRGIGIEMTGEVRDAKRTRSQTPPDLQK